MFYNNFCTITSLILTFFLYNFQLWWCCASNNLREDHWWSLLHMRGGDNVTSDSNHAGQESHCQKIAFAWTSNAFSISFPESVSMKGATRRGLEQRARERENHKDEASGVTHRMHDLLKRGARCTNATTGTKLRSCGMQWWRVGIAVMESCMNKVMSWVQAEAQLKYTKRMRLFEGNDFSMIFYFLSRLLCFNNQPESLYTRNLLFSTLPLTRATYLFTTNFFMLQC